MGVNLPLTLMGDELAVAKPALSFTQIFCTYYPGLSRSFSDDSAICYVLLVV